MKNLVLTGMMGSGKTTCARLLAEALGREMIDTDAEVVRRDGRPISRIFAEDGEKAFRDLETAVAAGLAGRSGLVIATGGGMVLRRENMDALRRNGFVVFLDRPAGQIFDTTSMAGRPLARDGKEAFLRTFAEREPLYRAGADYICRNFSAPAATVREILAVIKHMEGF